MQSQGLISSRTYSLWLDDLEDSTGTVLFGGYDTAKYVGDLTLLDIQPDEQTGEIDSMTVAWTSLALTDDSGSTLITPDDFPLPAVLDSGTTLTVIPSDLFEQLSDYFGAVPDESYGNLVDCGIGGANGSLDFEFGGGPIISVPFVELAVPAFDDDGNPLQFDDGTPACQFGVDQSPDGISILLGDTFLRSAYVVYDLDAQQIGIAQTNFNTTDSNIVEIGGNSSNPIPSASAATGVTAAQSATKLVGPGNSATITGSAPTGHPTSAGGIGSHTLSGVHTSLPVSTFVGSATGGHATSSGGAPTAAISTGSASSVDIAPFRMGSLLLLCWTAAALVVGGAAFSFLL